MVTFLSPSPAEPALGVEWGGGGSDIAFGHYCLCEAQKDVTVYLSWKGEEPKEGLMEMPGNFAKTSVH